MVLHQLVLSPIFLLSHGMPSLRTHLPFSPPAGVNRPNPGGGNSRTGGAHGRGAGIAVAQRKMGWGLLLRQVSVLMDSGPCQVFMVMFRVWIFVFQCCSTWGRVWGRFIQPNIKPMRQIHDVSSCMSIKCCTCLQFSVHISVACDEIDWVHIHSDCLIL